MYSSSTRPGSSRSNNNSDNASNNIRKRQSIGSHNNANMNATANTNMNANVNTNANSSHKSLLIRLSEACNQHKNNHHHHHSTSNSNNDNHNSNQNDGEKQQQIQYEKCIHELSILNNIIPKVESAYRLPYQKSKRDKRNNNTAGIGISHNKIHASDISNLCMFYHSVVMGSFCPYSKEILLQNNRNNDTGNSGTFSSSTRTGEVDKGMDSK